MLLQQKLLHGLSKERKYFFVKAGFKRRSGKKIMLVFWLFVSFKSLLYFPGNQWKTLQADLKDWLAHLSARIQVWSTKRNYATERSPMWAGDIVDKGVQHFFSWNPPILKYCSSFSETFGISEYLNQSKRLLPHNQNSFQTHIIKQP